MTVGPLLLDANLLVLYVVGTASRNMVGRHKRLKAYVPEDYDLLLNILSVSPSVVLTPNTLAGTSNLVGQVGEPIRSKIYEVLRYVVEAEREIYVPSTEASARPEFVRLGLTDCALLELLEPGVTLLTADLHLYLAACKRGGQAINFNWFCPCIPGHDLFAM